MKPDIQVILFYFITVVIFKSRNPLDLAAWKAPIIKITVVFCKEDIKFCLLQGP